MDFKTRLKEEMEYQGIQHKELAEKANVKPRALLTYVAASPSMPPADVAVRIAKALGVSVEYLVSGDENSKNMTGIIHRHLLQNFDKLNPVEQRAVSAMVETLASQR